MNSPGSRYNILQTATIMGQIEKKMNTYDIFRKNVLNESKYLWQNRDNREDDTEDEEDASDSESESDEDSDDSIELFAY